MARTSKKEGALVISTMERPETKEQERTASAAQDVPQAPSAAGGSAQEERSAYTPKEKPQDSAPLAGKPVFELEDVAVSYGKVCALAGVTMDVPKGQVTALIGPSGCGKTTLLRCFNRMNDEVGNVTVEGSFRFHGEEINSKQVDPVALRMRVGQVFQRPNPFPMSIYDNIAFGPRLQGEHRKHVLDDIVEESLRGSALFDEVKDILKKHAFELSGGQQQRLCIARALATKPEVLLMDEPCASLDPISTKQIEDTVIGLKGSTTVIIVTHSMTQAHRVSDQTAYLLRESMERPAELVETGPTEQVFCAPHDDRTYAYINGEFG